MLPFYNAGSFAALAFLECKAALKIWYPVMLASDDANIRIPIKMQLCNINATNAMQICNEYASFHDRFLRRRSRNGH
jgi:hypothetical protein